MIHIQNGTYKVSPDKTILNALNLEIKSGEIATILGPNGSGKSTLLKIITDEIQLTSGKMIRNFHPKDVRIVLQDFKQSTFENLSILENLQIAAYAQRQSLIKNPQIDIEYWIEKVNIDIKEKIHLPLFHLSGGQKQIISLIMAMLTRPKILILDEHTSALDPVMCDHLMQLTHSLCKKENITALIVTHNLDHALCYSDQILFLKNGNFIHDKKNISTLEEIKKLY
jgi:putative ABC transport system ATP-binding protein